MNDWLLPLFPLNAVLFPRTDLPLHIFEERYKQMIAECLSVNTEFGVVLAQENAVEQVGCTASVKEVVKRYDDGRLDIVVRGSRRFEVVLLNQDMPCLRGAPQFFDDDQDAVPPEIDSCRQALDLYGKINDLLDLKEPEADLSSIDPADAQLSFQIMARLPVDHRFKQSLLVSRSESERISQVVPFLEQLVVQVSLAMRVRSSASGNGKGR